MRNFSQVFLSSRDRIDFEFMSMTDMLNEDYRSVDTVFYIPADAKMDGL